MCRAPPSAPTASTRTSTRIANVGRAVAVAAVLYSLMCRCLVLGAWCLKAGGRVPALGYVCGPALGFASGPYFNANVRRCDSPEPACSQGLLFVGPILTIWYGSILNKLAQGGGVHS
jgi:hypothetical protein